MAIIHFISGLGADHRVFQNLDLPGYESLHLTWETPIPRESLSAYAQRLIAQIDQSKPVILIGVSFGGMIAQEIAKTISVKQVIILSSIQSANEMDWTMKLAKISKVYHLPPAFLLKQANLLTGDYYFGIKDKAESTLLTSIIKDTDNDFMKWAISAIMNWEPNSLVSGLIHIHGTEDRIFPYKNIRKAIPIEGGGHFMIFNRAKEISELIIQILKNNAN